MSKKQKLLNKFLEIPIRKELTFDELTSLLTNLGYIKINGTGSRVKFYHQQHDNLINLHKPHPGNILKTYIVKQIQAKIKEIL